jgi:hypothetical protein
LRLDFVVSEDDNINACLKQRRDNVTLQEVNDGHTVVGGDEDLFGHDTFLNREVREERRDFSFGTQRLRVRIIVDENFFSSDGCSYYE